jgi:hypothetical protein
MLITLTRYPKVTWDPRLNHGHLATCLPLTLSIHHYEGYPNHDVTLQQLKTMGKNKNSTNIIYLVDFPKCPLVNFISKNALQFFFVCHPS